MACPASSLYAFSHISFSQTDSDGLVYYQAQERDEVEGKVSLKEGSFDGAVDIMHMND